MSSSTSKRFYKIGEVADMLSLPASTLRFWETQFKDIRPRRNEKGTRFYTPADIEKLRMVSFLVHEKGMRIDAAEQEIRTNRDGVVRRADAVNRLRNVRDKLQALLDSLNRMR